MSNSNRQTQAIIVVCAALASADPISRRIDPPIFSVKKASYLCDEIAREEDPSYVTASLESGLYAFFRPEQFRGKRVLDFDCGSGASTMVLNRLLKGAEMYGVELDTRLLQIAKARAVHYGLAARPVFCVAGSAHASSRPWHV